MKQKWGISKTTRNLGGKIAKMLRSTRNLGGKITKMLRTTRNLGAKPCVELRSESYQRPIKMFLFG